MALHSKMAPVQVNAFAYGRHAHIRGRRATCIPKTKIKAAIALLGLTSLG